MSAGFQCFDSSGTLTFDSLTDNILFWLEQRVISPSEINRTGTITFSYPAYTGKKIEAFLTIYNSGEVDSWAIPSCRISYPSNVPTVSVFVDNTRDDLSIATTMLSILYTGANL